MGVFPVFGSWKMAGSDDARAEVLRCRSALVQKPPGRPAGIGGSGRAWVMCDSRATDEGVSVSG